MSKSHRHEFTLGEDHLICTKCGYRVPLISHDVEEKPPITLWAFIERLGGLGGKALYFHRVLNVREVIEIVFESRGNFRPHIFSLEQYESFEERHSGRYTSLFDIKAAKTGHILERDEKHIFLTLSRDDLLDEYFRVEAAQREYWKNSQPSKRGFTEKELKFVRLEVKLGKIQSLNFTDYVGSIEVFNGKEVILGKIRPYIRGSK